MGKNHVFDATAFFEESVIYWTSYGVIAGGCSIEQAYNEACDFIKGIHEAREICPLSPSLRTRIEQEIKVFFAKEAV